MTTPAHTQLSIPAGVNFFRKDMQIEPGLPFESWVVLGRYLGEMRRSVTFWQARFLGYGRREYGEPKVADALQQLAFEFEDVKCAEMLMKLETSPLEELTAEHHYVTAKAGLDEAAQKQWLQTAFAEKLSPSELRKSIVAGKVLREEEGSARGSKGAGVASPHAVRQQFDFYLRQIGDRWKTLELGEREQLHALLAPIALFVAELEVGICAEKDGERMPEEEAAPPEVHFMERLAKDRAAREAAEMSEARDIYTELLAKEPPIPRERIIAQFQTRLHIGYTRAAALLEMLENAK